MYNRYIRNDRGTYTRIPEEERRAASEPRDTPPPERPAPSDGFPPPERPAPSGGFPPPEQVPALHSANTGDFLLLGLLFFLLREGEDEELLIALALLLIL